VGRVFGKECVTALKEEEELRILSHWSWQNELIPFQNI
jgi:hypothetical protein